MPIFTGSLWPFNEIVVSNPPNVDVIPVDPPATLKRNPGSFALNSVSHALWYTFGSGNWLELSAGAGALDTLTGDTGTATPSAANIKIAGTANQITTAASGATVTLSLPSAITAPGSLSTTTTLAATTTVTGGTGVIATTGNISATAGAVNAGTSMTATLGDITATNGNFVGSTSGTGLSFPVVTASGAASGTVNCNGRVGSVTFTTVSIASNADLTLTLGNTAIAGASTRLLFSMSGATTGSALSVKSVTPGTGTYAWVVTNGDGAAIVTSVADITFDFIVLN